MDRFDFDEWVNLYKNDPMTFEQKRQQLIEQEIQKAPPELREKLRVIQFECDALKSTLPPLEAAAEITKLAAQRLNQLTAPLTELREILEDLYDNTDSSNRKE